METDLSFLVTRQESNSTLVRFEDETDANAPRLNYSVPLPGAFQGKLFLETDFENDEVPWTAAARSAAGRLQALTRFTNAVRSGEAISVPPIDRIASVPRLRQDRSVPAEIGFVLRDASGTQRMLDSGSASVGTGREVTRIAAPGRAASNDEMTLSLRLGALEVDLEQIADELTLGRVPVIFQRFGGDFDITFVPEPDQPAAANPRFVIIEHYRLSSFFGDYGAGRTLGTFSLMPGEETKLYLRTFRRSEATSTAASSIFDSYTSEAASEFETDLQTETTNIESEAASKTLESKYKGSGEINIGLAKTKHSGERNSVKENSSARENIAKNVAKTTAKHASKASSQRDISVTQELTETEESEFERIVERTITNTNLSRTLNIVTRELNQEFSSYFALYDVTVAFLNDRGVFEVFQVHEIDDMIEKYIEDTPTGEIVAPGPFGALTPRSFVRTRLVEQINQVYDFQGTRHALLEEVILGDDGEQAVPVGSAPAGANTYLRVKRPRGQDADSPFYAPGEVPVEGVVMNVSNQTVRTPAVIIDALLGHGVALDNYALGLQQETLRERQLENQKTELALALLDGNDAERLDQFRSLFGGADRALLERAALGDG